MEPMSVERPRTLLTLCLVHEAPRILLGMKKRGFGAGRWNGFGGKVEEGETITEAAERELREEAGIRVRSMEPAGTLFFTFIEDPLQLEVHVFRGAGVEGTPTETDEMRPQWFEETAIPYEHMWLDDIHWFPFFLRHEEFTGTFLFQNQQTLLNSSVVPRGA